MFVNVFFYCQLKKELVESINVGGTNNVINGETPSTTYEEVTAE